MALILESGGGDGVVADRRRAILDHIFVPQQASSAAAGIAAA